MIDKTDSEEFGLGFGFREPVDDPFPHDYADCDCTDELDEDDLRVELELPPLKVAPPRLEVEIEFDESEDGAQNGYYADNVDTIYIEAGELRLVDGPIAQVIDLDDITFMRATIK